MRWVAAPSLRTTVPVMAVTESGHLASREIDDLYRAHVAEVYRYAYAVLGNHADAEDVTQTTFLNAYRALEQGVRPRKPTNWLLTIASNAIKQRFRQEQSRPRQVEFDERIAQAGTDDEDDEGPSVGELLTALSKIPPQQRQAIVLREFEGRSYNEIAEILGMTTSALETLSFGRDGRSPRSSSISSRVPRRSSRCRSPSTTGSAERKAPPARSPGRVPGLRPLRSAAAAPSLRASRARPRSDPALADALQGSRRNRVAAIVPVSAGAGAVAVGAGSGHGATAAGTTGECSQVGSGSRSPPSLPPPGSPEASASPDRARSMGSPRSHRVQQPSRRARLGQVGAARCHRARERRRSQESTRLRGRRRPPTRRESTQGQKAKAKARGQEVSAAKRKAAAQRRAPHAEKAPQSRGRSAATSSGAPTPLRQRKADKATRSSGSTIHEATRMPPEIAAGRSQPPRRRSSRRPRPPGRLRTEGDAKGRERRRQRGPEER